MMNERVTDLRIGTAGWSYRDWNGVVYPANRPRGFHELEYLSEFLPLLEINTTFYRPLGPEVARVWVRKLARRPGFRFTAKLFRGFTHEGSLDRATVQRFRDGLEPLVEAGLFGCLLMQFPHSFRMTTDNLRRVLRLAGTFSHYPTAAEFRHSSWDAPEALSALADRGVAFCNIDQPRLNRCLPPTAHVTSSIGYVRLHGRNYHEWFNFDDDARRSGPNAAAARYDYLYSIEQLGKWRERVESVAQRTAETYVVMNNHFLGQAAVNALQLLAMTEGRPVEAPPTLTRRYPELNDVPLRPPAQRTLFFDSREPAPVVPKRRAAVAAYARA